MIGTTTEPIQGPTYPPPKHRKSPIASRESGARYPPYADSRSTSCPQLHGCNVIVIHLRSECMKSRLTMRSVYAFRALYQCNSPVHWSTSCTSWIQLANAIIEQRRKNDKILSAGVTIPPAKPEACICEPLKAVDLLATSKVARPYLNKFSCSNRRSSSS